MSVYFYGLLVILALATLTWGLSIIHRNVSIVDSVWGLMILAGAYSYVANVQELNLRIFLILALVMFWAVRLSVYLSWRNWGEPEDHRYQDIRARYQPNFVIKSLFVIFLFQAGLAWVISLPLWPALTGGTEIRGWDIAAVTLWSIGMLFEAVGDWQLARFKANPANHGKVMDRGLWRYTRHPNYFGECLVWWGFYLFALSAGAWWSIVSPLLMTWLLLRFSGVVMLEKSIGKRRPGYSEYVSRTNAFFPGRPRKRQPHPGKLGEQTP